MKLKFLSLPILAWVLLGCHVGPEYSPPATEAPAEWKESLPDPPNTMPLTAWWEIFNDCILNDLEVQALTYSPTLEQAIARVNEEYALLRVKEANNFPFLTFNPINMVTGTLINTQGGPPLSTIIPNAANIPPGGGLGAGGPMNLQRVRIQTTTLPLEATYEVDLWGKREDSIMAALARAQASQEGYNSVWLKLTADVATAYFQMRALQAQLEILDSTLDSRKKEVELNNDRYTAGIVNESDVSLAKVELANAEFEILDTKRLYAIQEDALAVLIGEFPSSFSLGAQAIQDPPPVVPLGIPSQLLLRRPDISEAERNMAAFNADVRYYYADFFPTLSLNGTLGYSSPTIANLFQWRARLWSWAISSASTLFDAGQKCAALDAAKARYIQAVATYEQTVLVAFQEVEDSLSNLLLYNSQYEAAIKGEKAAQVSLDISRTRYTRGLENYLDVVVNERTLLTEQLKRIGVLSDEYLNTILLVKSLGGGWEDECEDEEL